MGYVNKPDGKWNKHEWNWPEVEDGKAKRAFHVLTPDEKSRKDLGKPSLPAKSTSTYIHPEIIGGTQSLIRQSNISTRRVTKEKTGVRNRRVTGLQLCEANMVMYLNSLDIGVFDPNNPEILKRLDIKEVNDDDLKRIHENEIENYNKKDFDVLELDLTDNNDQKITHEVKYITQSKSDPSAQTLTEFVEANRTSSVKSTYSDFLKQKGLNLEE